MKKLQDYNRKQEIIMMRQREKEIELKKTLAEKAIQKEEREKKLKETKIRHENQTEEVKQELTEKLKKVNERVKLIILKIM